MAAEAFAHPTRKLDQQGHLKAISTTAQPAGGKAVALDPTGALPASLATGSEVTGVIPASGTTPTAGTGFTYTHTGGTGTYVFTFTPALSGPPCVNVQVTDGSTAISLTAVSATGFSVAMSGGAEHSFTFRAKVAS